MASTRTVRAVLAHATVLVLTLASARAFAQLDAGAIDAGSADAAAAPASLAATDFNFAILRFDPARSAWVELAPTEQVYFFNRARCECAADTANFGGHFKIAIKPSSVAGDTIRALLSANGMGSGRAALYAGTNVVNCLAPSGVPVGALANYCLNLLDPASHATSIPGGMAALAATQTWLSPPIPVAWLFNAARAPIVCNSPASCSQTSTCGATTAAVTLYFWAQTSGATAPDRIDLSLPITLVGQAPLTPSNVRVEAGNQALGVAWSWPEGVSPPATHPSMVGVQLFCQRGEGDQVFPSGTHQPAYSSAASLCPAVAPVPEPPLPFANLSPSFLCSGLLPATTTHYRIPGLQNGIFYGVSVAAVDKLGNLSASDPVYGAPIETDAGTDGSAVDGGGSATVRGGGCAVAGGAGRRDAWASLGLLGLGALVAARRRRRRSR